MPRTTFNISAGLAAAGVVLFYSFWPIALAFGEYEGSLFRNNPDQVGLGTHHFRLVFPILGCSIILSMMNMMFLMITLLVVKVLARKPLDLLPFSKWSIGLVLGTAVMTFLLLRYDPGGYLIWLFD